MAALRSPADGRGVLWTGDSRCYFQTPFLLRLPPLLPPDWEPGLPWFLPAMSLGMNGLGGKGEGGTTLVLCPSHFGKMRAAGDGGGVIWLHLERRGRAESGAWDRSYI